RLAALAHVGPAPGRTELADRITAVRARLLLAEGDQELVLKASAGPVRGAEVVDRRALGLQPGHKRLDARVAQGGALGSGEAVRRPQRVHPSPEQRLVGIDVPDASDALLIEKERLYRRARHACERVEVLRRELVAERLDAEPRVEEGRELLGPER